MTNLINHNFNHLKYAVTTHTSAQTTSDLAETFTTISGSECDSYAVQGTHAVYTFNFSAYKSGVSIGVIKLEYADVGSSSYSEVDSLNRRNIGNAGSSSQFNRWALRYSWIVPSWTGAKKFRVQIGHPSTNQALTCHALDVWDGASTSTEFYSSSYYIYSI